MADKYTPEMATSGKERLRTWWKKVENNFVKIFGAVNKHIDGTADRHTADMIDYSDTETVGEKLETKVDKVEGKGLVSTADIRTAVENNKIKFKDGIAFAAPAAVDPSGYSFKIDGDGLYLGYGGGSTTVENGDVIIDRGGEVHKLSEKANTADVFLKSGDVVIADGKKISFDGEPYGYGLTLGKNGITIETVNENEYIDTVSVSPSEVTVTKYDSAGNDCVHKLSEKANSADIGTLSDLATTDKSSIVAAINEVKASGGGDVLDNLTYDSTNDIINSSANLLLENSASVAAYNGTFRGDIKIGQLGANKWAYRISPITGFSTSVDVTCTSGNKRHSLANKADSNDVLTKTNTAAFTPTGDYQPATKKYVDDTIKAAIEKYNTEAMALLGED